MQKIKLFTKRFTPLFMAVCFTFFMMPSGFGQKGSNCPDDLVPKYDRNIKMWGFANLFGQWVINPIYTKVSPYVENKAVVMKGSKFGVIDCEGNVILAPEYDRLTNFKYGKIWAMKNGLWGLLNEKGGTVLEHQYSEINPIAFTELSWVKKNDLWGLLSEEKGSFVCRPQFKIAQIMSENATLVQLKEPTFGVVNHVDCSYLLPHEITRVKKVAPHTIIFEQGNKWGVFNEWGKIVSNAVYDSIAPRRTVYDSLMKSYDLVLVTMKDRKYGLMNLGGKELIPPQFEDVSEFSDGFFRIREKGKYGYASRIGKVYIKPQYEEASLFNDGQAIVKKDGKYGVIDVRGQYVMPLKYSHIDRNPESRFYAVEEKGGAGMKTYLYGLNAKKISPEAFDSVYVSDSPDLLRVKKDGKVKFYNVPGGAYAFEGSFDQAAAPDLGYILVSIGGKWGVSDLKGKLVVPAAFDKIEYAWFNNKMVFRTSLNGKWGISENTGKVILANEYDLIAPAAPFYLKVRKNGKYGVVRNNGEAVTEFIYDFISNEVETPGIPEWPAIVVVKEKYGLLNEKGAYVLEPKALKIEYLEENMYSVKEKKDVIIINSKGAQAGSGKFDEVRAYGNGLAAFRKGSKWGYVDKNGDEKIKARFDDAGMFIQHMAPVKVNGLWGVIDVNGKEMAKPEYDKYITEPDGTRNFFKGSNSYTLMKGGVMK